MMKKYSRQIGRFLLLAAWLMSLPGAAWAADATETLVAMLRSFEQSKDARHADDGNAILALLVGEGFGDDTQFTAATPRDTVDMTVWYYAAEYFLVAQQYGPCVDYARKALPLTDGNGDYTWKLETLNLLTLGSMRLSDLLGALNYGRQMYAIDSQHDDYDRLSSTLNTIAGIYLMARQRDMAQTFAQKAIEADGKSQNHAHTPAVYGLAGEVYLGVGEPEQALQYATKAYQLELQRGDTAKAAIRLSQMAAACVELKDTAQARRLLDQAIPTLQQAGNATSLAISYNTLGQLLTLEGQTTAAVATFRQAYAMFQQMGDGYNRSRSLHGLHEALRQTQPQQAMLYLEHYTRLRDSLYHDDMKRMFTDYSAQYHNDELTTENARAHRQNRLIITGGLLVAVAMLLAIGLLVFAIRKNKRSNQFLRDVQRARNTFFTNVTHEFRTPLTVILGTTQQLTQGIQKALGTGSQNFLDSLDAIERNGNQLLTLINQLLDISKVQANVVPPDWRRGNVVAYLSMVVESFYDYAHQHGIDLIFAPRENDVEMDFVADYMQKIANNLLSNAIKFTPENGRVRITTQASDTDFTLIVADTGCGIARQDVAHIFDPFYQASNGTASSAPGSGVGLSLVKQIVESVDGQITCDSSPGKGSVFTVRLPLRQQDAAPLPFEAASSAAVAPLAVPASQSPDTTEAGEAIADGDADSLPRVLVVEDNKDVAAYIGRQLESSCSVSYAVNGRVGIEKAQRIMPDLIITDLMMPDTDGLELCRQIRSSDLTNHIPIIIITAKSTPEDRVRGLEAGADAYLYKPFNADELQVRVAKLLEQRQLLREKFSTTLDSEGSEQSQQLLGEADRKFMGRLTDLVCSYMSRGAVDVDTIASSLHMSPSQLRRKVTAITGKTPASYFLQVRLSNSQRIIDANPGISISEVALRCGFSDVAHFSHAFQKAFGISPTQWAKRAR